MMQIDHAKVERCKRKLLRGYFNASIVESTLGMKDFSQELHHGLDFLKFGTWQYLPKEWFTDPANYPDFVFSEIGRGIARSEEKYIIDQTINCKKTAIENIDQFTIDSLLKAAAELVSPRNPSRLFTLFLPIAYYKSVFIEWGLKDPMGEVRIEKDHLYVGPFEFRLLWSNKFMDFNKIVVVTTPFAEWVAKPSVKNRLEVSLVESKEKIDQMELRAETKFNFRIENAEQIKVLSAPLPSKPDYARETKARALDQTLTRHGVTEPEKSTENNTPEFTLLSEYIAPWALPKEEIPVHLVWTSDIGIDKIQLLLAPNTTVKQFYNVKSLSRIGKEITIHKLHSSNFFGFTIISNKLINANHERKEIKVNFFANGKIVRSRSLFANIYRPELSIIEKPEGIVLKDDVDIRELLNVTLRISGFGSIEVSTEISLGEEFQPNVEPIFQEMARRIATVLRKDDFSMFAGKPGSSALTAKEETKKKSEVKPLSIKKTIRLFIDQVRKGRLSYISKDEFEEFRIWSSKEENAERLRRFLSENIETIIIESLLYYFNKYPTEGIALSGGNPSVYINDSIDQLKIRFRYKDSVWNEYKPISFEIAVQDLRTNKSKAVRIPINIHWAHEEIKTLTQEGKC